MSDERWLPVVGFEGFLEVSDQGRIRSLDRLIWIKHPSKPYSRMRRGRIRKQAPDRQGYMHVPLWGGGKVRHAKVHHVVLEAFVGPRPEGTQCCHANNNPSDNRLENLRWDTFEANLADKVASGNHLRTQCIKGHEFTPENTVMHKRPSANATKRCRICQTETNREMVLRNKLRRHNDPEYAERLRIRDREAKRRRRARNA